MSNVVPRVAKVTDHQARCRDCGVRLSQPETIITYWDYVTQDGMSGTKITEKGISSIDINAGLCDDCLAKKLRKELDTRSFAAKTQDTGAPGTGAVALCWIGIFVFTLLLLLKVTKLDEYGRPAPIFTVWFFIFAAGLLASIIGLPIAISRRKKLCSQAVSTIEEDLKLSDGQLLTKYAIMDGYPFAKKAWSDYMVIQMMRGQGGIVYASEILKMGPVEEIMKKLHVQKDVALQLLSAAQSYSHRAL
jgi:hypothetical protein